jgi:cytochrome c oxidase subunit 1
MNDKKVNIMKIGLLRGLLFMLVAWPVGTLLVSVIRLVMGLPAFLAWDANARTFLFTEPAWVGGAILGVVAFMLGTGVTNDWLKWMNGEETPEHPVDTFPSGWARYLSPTYDHKAIGIQYGVTSLIVFLLAGFCLTFRTGWLPRRWRWFHTIRTIRS